MSTERDVYHAELRKLGHGLPIYEPDPAGEYDKVRVGDVGYVDRFGFFHRIFNAFLPRDDPINLQYGIPDDFEPLASGFTATFHRNPLPAGAMHSTYVRRLGGDFGVSGSCVPANASIKFSVSNQKGAALIIKYPAFREDTRSEKKLRDYMLRNYHSWITFFRDDLGYDIALQDIVLVTGCDLTADWATATFTERTTQCEIEFKVGDPVLGPSGSSAFWGTWQSSIHVPHRCGPCPVRPAVTLNSHRAIEDIPSPGHDSSEGPNYNQCIFLRGFRVRERTLLAPRIIKAAAEPHDLGKDRDQEGDMTPIISSLESDSDEGDVEMSESICAHSPRKTYLIYGSLLEHILKETGSDVAIIHDNDVFNFVKHIEIDQDNVIDLKSLQESEVRFQTYTDELTGEKVGFVVDRGIDPAHANFADAWLAFNTGPSVPSSIASSYTHWSGSSPPSLTNSASSSNDASPHLSEEAIVDLRSVCAAPNPMHCSILSPYYNWMQTIGTPYFEGSTEYPTEYLSSVNMEYLDPDNGYMFPPF